MKYVLPFDNCTKTVKILGPQSTQFHPPIYFARKFGPQFEEDDRQVFHAIKTAR